MARSTVLLYPGAGSDREHSRLLAIDDALTPAADVHRFDFPYRREGRKGPPDRAPKLMASMRDDLAGFSRRRGPVIMGGHSMGGRMASMVAANMDEAGPVARLAALVLVAYPLHPPRKPEKLRVEHLPAIEVPCLFVSGTRDDFGTPDELMSWTATIPGRVEHHWVDGGRHDLKSADAEVARIIADFIATLA